MRCRICGTDKDHPTYVVPEMMFGSREAFDYFQCTECACLQIADYPADLDKYYGESYYSYAPLGQPLPLVDRVKTHLQDRYEISRRGRIGRWLSERDPNPLLANLASVLQDRKQRILEVGCGSGALLQKLRTIGFRHLTGADAFIECDRRLDKDVVILKASLDEVAGRFDLIMFHHSLEHLPDQHAVFKQILERLRPGGKCVIRVPLSSSFAWEHYGVDWVQLDAPRHFYLHSIESLQRLADTVGLRLSKTIFDSTTFQFWGSEQYRRGIPLRDARSLMRCKVADSTFSREQMAVFRQRAAELNQAQRGDQAAFIFTLPA